MSPPAQAIECASKTSGVPFLTRLICADEAAPGHPAMELFAYHRILSGIPTLREVLHLGNTYTIM